MQAPLSQRPKRRVARRSQRVMAENVYIISFGVSRLFGKIDYSEVIVASEQVNDDKIGVIFGDNGTGKTTLLHLIYATLSSQDNAGLRTYIAKTYFKQFFVTLSDGTTITLLREDDSYFGSYRYKVDGPKISLDLFIEASLEGIVRDQDSVNELHRFLKYLDLDVLFVDHERYVRSTYAFLNDTSYAEDHLFLYNSLDASDISRGRDTRKRDKSLQFPLAGMIDAVNLAFRSQAFRQGTAGDVNASSVYLEIVRAIARRKKPGPSPQKDEMPFEALLESLEGETSSYVAHGLLSSYPFQDILQLYDSSSKPRRDRIKEALTPFIASINRRVAALKDVHTLMKNFEQEVNLYLRDKTASVHALDGLLVKSEDRALNINMLSSGERQLLFLLSAAIVSRGARSLILIDEPELSLNYKWQRRIASSLRTLSSASSTQFIMATHSIEIISKFAGTAFELENESS